MFKTLDRYIIKKFLLTFFFTCLIFSLVSVVIDASERVDNFFEEKLGFKQIFLEYYLNFIPNINGLLWPLFVLISVIFFTSRLAFNSEIIALLGTGVNYFRFMRPYVVAAIFIAGLHFVGNHFVIPKGNKKRIAFENTYIYKHNYVEKTDNIHLFGDSTTLLYIKHYNKSDNVASNLTIETIRDGRLEEKLTASRAKWNEEKGKWELKSYVHRKLDGLNETLVRGQALDTLLNLRPEDLARRDNIKEAMTTPEMRQFIQNERDRGAANFQIYEVEMHRRTADPFTIILLTIIGMTVAGRKVRGGMGLHLAIGAMLGGLFIFLTKFSSTFSINGGLSPLVGTWIPNIIFFFVAIYLIHKAQK